MATNTLAATQREMCILLPGMEPHIDFTSLGTFVCSLPFRAVSYIVSTVVFVCKPESCCVDVRTLTPCGVEETTAMVFCLGPCRVPGLGQSALSLVVGSAGSCTTSSCCPLLEVTLVVNPVHCATIRLFNPIP